MLLGLSLPQGVCNPGEWVYQQHPADEDEQKG
jgi:hypothetical protein